MKHKETPRFTTDRRLQSEPFFQANRNAIEHSRSTAAQPRRPNPKKRELESDVKANSTNPLCDCGTPSVQRTVKRSGPNHGKRFLTCSKPATNQCRFFEWDDRNPAHPQQNSLPGSHQQHFFPNANSTESKPAQVPHESPVASIPNCRCGEPAVSRTVERQGANQGRVFLVCAKPQAEQCGFFEWQQNGTPNVSFIPESANSLYPSHPALASKGSPSEVLPTCRCGHPAKKKSKSTVGPELGKEFFVCSKPLGEQCGFFEWAGEKSRVPNRLDATGMRGGVGGVAPVNAAMAHPGMDLNGSKSSGGLIKRPPASGGVVRLELEEADTVSFHLSMSSPKELKEAVRKFEGLKISKTGMLGIEKAVLPIEKLDIFESYIGAKACATIDCRIPRETLRRVQQFKEAEKRREDSGDVVKQSLDEVLPPIVCEKLMEFQWEGVHFALKRGGRCLIGDDMGLGKTLQAIAVARVYMEDWPLLIICPSSLRLNWQEELLLWLDGDIVADDILVMMTGKDIGRPLRQANIVSYDLVRKIPDHRLAQCNFIIADESHYLKSGTAKRSKAVTPLIKRAKRALLLSGTPALSRPVELFTQINAISPVMFPNYNDYVTRYCDAHVGRFGYDVTGASNLPELHTLLQGSVLIRRKKEHVLTQLPDKQRQVLWVQTKPKALVKQLEQALKDYEMAQENAHDAVSDEQAAVLQNVVRAAQTKVYTLTGLVKVEAVLEFCKDTAESGCKFIVFAHHSDVIDKVDEYLTKKLKLGIIRIDGGTQQSARQPLCKTFQTDPNCRVALLSITAAGVGLTLTKATVVLFAELYWNPGSLLQAEDRAHRIGQKDCVLVKYLLAKGTLDEQMWKTVRRKMNVVGQSLTGKAGRIEVNNDPDGAGQAPGALDKYFKRKNNHKQESTSEVTPQNTQSTQETAPQHSPGVPHQDDSVIIIDDDSLPQINICQQNQLDRGNGKPTRSEVSLPASLRELGIPPSGSRRNRMDSQPPESTEVIDLTEARKLQEQLDADVSLARKLQAQFDAEEV